jgi:hypothetical protein
MSIFHIWFYHLFNAFFSHSRTHCQCHLFHLASAAQFKVSTFGWSGFEFCSAASVLYDQFSLSSVKLNKNAINNTQVLLTRTCRTLLLFIRSFACVVSCHKSSRDWILSLIKLLYCIITYNIVLISGLLRRRPWIRIAIAFIVRVCIRWLTTRSRSTRCILHTVLFSFLWRILRACRASWKCSIFVKDIWNQNNLHSQFSFNHRFLHFIFPLQTSTTFDLLFHFWGWSWCRVCSYITCNCS